MSTRDSAGPGAHWRPMADMRNPAAMVVVSGEGSWITDWSGKQYLDATAGLWFCQVGYGRREIADAIHAQSLRMHAYHTFGDYSNEPAIALAGRLSDCAPGGPWKVFFTSGGSDSTDTVLKLVRRYWQLQGEPERSVVLSRTGAYHGLHVGATEVTGMDVMREGFENARMETDRVAWDDPADLERAITTHGSHRVAAFFCEPIMGAGGMFFPPDGYLAAVRDICLRHGVLLVADEVVTGFGRGAHWFISERFDLQPDLILCAKGITSGYLPLGAVLVSGRVAEPFWDEGGTAVFRHGYTYSGHATAAAAALANLDYIVDHDLLAAASRIEHQLPELFGGLAELPLVESVRTGPAALGAIQFDLDAYAADPTLPGRAVTLLREVGVLTRPLACGAVQVSPALTISDAELSELAQRFERGLATLAPV